MIGRTAKAALIATVLVAGPVAAKPAKKGHAPAARKPAAATVVERSATSTNTTTTTSTSTSTNTSTSSSTEESTSTTSTPSGGKIKTKSYTFGAMDVEGKLKTPQLLYFLNRVKLELDMSAPDKRSFMKELEQSADDKNL